MRTKYALPLFIATLFAAVGVWAGCTVGFDTTADGNTFVCTSGDDCIKGYYCQGLDAGTADSGQEGTCQPEGTTPDGGDSPPCEEIDGDGDGFGTGTDRSNCPGDEPDCDDTDSSVYPDAPELCDNKLNDCRDWPEDAGSGEGEDDFSCPCGSVPSDLQDRFQFFCENETCTLIPFTSGSDDCENGDQMKLTCDGSEFTWELNGQPKGVEDVPSACY